MLFKAFRKLTLAILFTLFGYCLNAQSPNILVVPYQSFDFLIEFDAAEIDSINNLGGQNQVFKAVQDSLLKQLLKPHNKFNYSIIPAVELQSIQNRIRSIYKTKPTGHMGKDISSILKSGDLEKIMKNFQADYILFLSQHSIRKRIYSTSRSFDGSYLLSWSRHLIDYEMYNSNGELIIMADDFELKTPLPNNENYIKKGLIINEMNWGYRSILRDIQLKLEKYKPGKKAIYKVKH